MKYMLVQHDGKKKEGLLIFESVEEAKQAGMALPHRHWSVEKTVTFHDGTFIWHPEAPHQEVYNHFSKRLP